tara:strand:- start:52 stop:633 length:582 start_codon:yes stop_codon:yes gene_type:complete
MTTQEKKMRRLRVVNNVKLSMYGIYIVDNFLEEKYHKKVLKKVKELTKKDIMGSSTNVQANMTDYRELFKHQIFQSFFNDSITMLHYIYTLRSMHPNEAFEFNLLDGWAMKHCKGDRTMMHTHGPNCWSAAYYPRIPSETYMHFPDFEHSELLKENSLYLFHGLTRHGVDPQAYKEPRYSMSFNVEQLKIQTK